jgi:hypothetical protein
MANSCGNTGNSSAPAKKRLLNSFLRGSIENKRQGMVFKTKTSDTIFKELRLLYALIRPNHKSGTAPKSVDAFTAAYALLPELSG